jgi:hypothetical protein
MRNLKAALGAAGALMLLGAGAARADTFVLYNTPEDCAAGCEPPGDGSAGPDGSGGLVLFGSDNQSDVGTTATLLATASAPEVLKFNYVYQTFDEFGTDFDPAGYVLNGVFTQLSVYENSVNPLDPFDPTIFPEYAPETGSVTFSLSAGDTYGFYVLTGDNIDGPGSIDFTLVGGSLQLAIPEPATWAMMLAGFGLAGTFLRRKRRAWP